MVGKIATFGKVGIFGGLLWNAFAAGYAYAKAVFEHQRARRGVKGRLRRRAKRAP